MNATHDPYRLGAEVFVEPYQDQFLVYFPTRRTAILADEMLAEAFRALRNGTLTGRRDPGNSMAALLDVLQLDASHEDDAASHITNFTGLPAPTSVTLFLTTSCNLRCSYCCVSAGERKPVRMSPATAFHGIDYIIQNALRYEVGEVSVGFVAAGEATVNWETLTAAYEYGEQKARRAGLVFRTTLKTNGIFSGRKADWIIQNIDEVQISFDGLPSDGAPAPRLTAAGSDSTEQVERTLRHFEAANKPYKLRVTVTRERIRLIPQVIEYICDNFGPRSVQIEPAYRMGRYQDAPTYDSNEFLTMFRQALESAAAKGIPLLFGGANIDTLKNHYCGASADEFSLSASGNVTACSTASTEDDPLASVFFYGKPNGDAYSFDMNVLDNLRGRSVENREFCTPCLAKWHCGGECHYSLVSGGNAENFSGTERCHVVRELVKDALAKRIKGTGTNIWVDPAR